eukprot:scaffold165456_cov19-Tisochrysis_lutea.AAC.3
MITALRKSPWGAGLVNMEIESDDQLAQRNQTPLCASNQARHLTEDQHSYPRKTASSTYCKPAARAHVSKSTTVKIRCLCHSWKWQSNSMHACARIYNVLGTSATCTFNEFVLRLA